MSMLKVGSTLIKLVDTGWLQAVLYPPLEDLESFAMFHKQPAGSETARAF